jgi:hypothetical protein
LVLSTAVFLYPILVFGIGRAYFDWWKPALPFATAFALSTVCDILISLSLLAVFCWYRRLALAVFLSSSLDITIAWSLFDLAILTTEPELKRALAQLGIGHLPEILFAFGFACVLSFALRVRRSCRARNIGRDGSSAPGVHP